MTNIEILKEYIRLSDVMYQALKAEKYKIFENALEKRGSLVKDNEKRDDLFSDLSDNEKSHWRKKILEIDSKTEKAMGKYRKVLERELAQIHSSQAKLRKHSKVKSYYSQGYESQGKFVNKLK